MLIYTPELACHSKIFLIYILLVFLMTSISDINKCIHLIHTNVKSSCKWSIFNSLTKDINTEWYFPFNFHITHELLGRVINFIRCYAVKTYIDLKCGTQENLIIIFSLVNSFSMASVTYKSSVFKIFIKCF